MGGDSPLSWPHLTHVLSNAAGPTIFWSSRATWNTRTRCLFSVTLQEAPVHPLMALMGLESGTRGSRLKCPRAWTVPSWPRTWSGPYIWRAHMSTTMSSTLRRSLLETHEVCKIITNQWNCAISNYSSPSSFSSCTQNSHTREVASVEWESVNVPSLL